ncbi:hypothetical protein J2Z75_000625 [Rhizobium herbae]|uniref:Uncharacterized protein n=1 Tax=Rhizobium herbae TaxID=508661 RepID=A0ABS4EGS0_9HYPH|nr:hypothetical protein [Rhizobium herbae]
MRGTFRDFGAGRPLIRRCAPPSPRRGEEGASRNSEAIVLPPCGEMAEVTGSEFEVPPSVGFADISPTRGEIGSVVVAVTPPRRRAPTLPLKGRVFR